MNTLSGIDLIVAALCLLAALIAAVQLLRRARRGRGWLAALQIPCALLLLSALLLRDPPPPEVLIVLGPGADLHALPPSEDRAPVVALATAEPGEDIEASPDLATALRQRPGVTHVHFIGNGLQAQDLAALGDRDLSFTPSAPAPERSRLLELEAPTQVIGGEQWNVRGRVSDTEVTVELIDPAQQRVAQALPGDDGRFLLQGLSRASGTAMFELSLRRGDDELQRLPLPIQAREATPLRAQLLAAAPSPELKYLRRWASDAGLRLDSHIALAPGIELAGSNPALDAAALAQLDLLMVDERSWARLERHADDVRAAVAQGMGLLLRVTGPIPEQVLQRWRSFGVDLIQQSEPPRAVKLADAAAEPPAGVLHAWPITPQGDRHVTLWRDSEGKAIATQHALGRGRIGVLWLSDSFRLHTRGEASRHATLWSELVSAIARARGEVETEVPARAVVGQRAVICRPQGELRVMAPDASEITLLRDPDNPECAAFWPRASGWHRVLADAEQNASGATVEPPDAATAPADEQRDDSLAFHVFDPRSIDSLLSAQSRAETLARVNRSEPPAVSTTSRDSLRAAALLGWLMLIAFSWWGERRARRATAA